MRHRGGWCRTVRRWTSAGTVTGLGIGMATGAAIALLAGSAPGAFVTAPIGGLVGAVAGFCAGAAAGLTLVTLAATPALAPTARHRTCTASVVAAAASGVVGLLAPYPLLLLLLSGGQLSWHVLDPDRPAPLVTLLPVLLPTAAAGMAVAAVVSRRLPPGQR